MDEGSLGVHEIELVVKTSPCLSDGGGVSQHADSSLDLGQVTSRNNGWRLVVNTDLEASWAPVDKLKCSLDNFVDINMLFLIYWGLSILHNIMISNKFTFLRVNLSSYHPRCTPLSSPFTWIDFLVFIREIAVLTSLGTTSPR